MIFHGMLEEYRDIAAGIVEIRAMKKGLHRKNLHQSWITFLVSSRLTKIFNIKRISKSQRSLNPGT